MSDERHSAFKTVVTFLTGAAIGAGLALLFAPQTGKETRKKIKEMGEKISDEVKEDYEKVSEQARKTIGSVKSASERALGQVKSFIGRPKESAKKGIK